jgi:hypothetical protein
MVGLSCIACAIIAKHEHWATGLGLQMDESQSRENLIVPASFWPAHKVTVAGMLCLVASTGCKPSLAEL